MIMQYFYILSLYLQLLFVTLYSRNSKQLAREMKAGWVDCCAVVVQ